MTFVQVTHEAWTAEQAVQLFPLRKKPEMHERATLAEEQVTQAGLGTLQRVQLLWSKK